jgi:hypothetical protein
VQCTSSRAFSGYGLAMVPKLGDDVRVSEEAQTHRPENLNRSRLQSHDSELTQACSRGFEEFTWYVTDLNFTICKMIDSRARRYPIAVQHHPWARCEPLSARNEARARGSKTGFRTVQSKRNSGSKRWWGWGLVRACPARSSCKQVHKHANRAHMAKPMWRRWPATVLCGYRSVS